MKSDIEIEVRGLLSEEEYYRVNTFLKENGTFKEEKNRTLIDYSTYLPNEGVRDRTKDIRVRMTNGVPEIVVKLGSWGGSESRRELSFKGVSGDFDTLVEIFGHLGLSRGVLAERHTLAYEYKGIEFALVTVPNHSYYFEAEKMANASEDVASVEEEIKLVCAEIGLSVISREGFFELSEVPEVCTVKVKENVWSRLLTRLK
jgi:adenylate cyclase class IV